MLGRREERRKLIVFTEHRDTLDYLVGGSDRCWAAPRAVEGDPRRRRAARTAGITEEFTPEPGAVRCCSPPTPPARA